jgi:hypothetical protein
LLLQATVTDLALVQGAQYTVSVRAIDGAGRATAAKQATVVVDATPPTAGTRASVCGVLASNGKVELDFTDLFAEDACTDADAAGGSPCLRYEVSVGRSATFGDLAFRKPTDETTLTFGTRGPVEEECVTDTSFAVRFVWG